jgi:hypothetical protein
MPTYHPKAMSCISMPRQAKRQLPTDIKATNITLSGKDSLALSVSPIAFNRLLDMSLFKSET